VKRVLIVVVLLLAAAGGILYALASTESGLRWLAARATGLLPAGSDLGDVRGRARGPVEVAGVRVVAGGFVVEVEHATIEWAPLALLAGTAHLEQVTARGVRVRRTGGARDGSGGAPRLPVVVQIDALAVHGFELATSPDATPVRLDEIALAGRLEASRIDVRDLRARGLGAQVSGDVALGPGPSLEGDLAWSWTPPGMAPLAGALRARRDADEIAITQTLAAPYDATFEGRLDPGDKRLRGRLSAPALALDALNPGWPALRIGADVDVDGTLDGLVATLDGTLARDAGAPLSVTATVRADRERVTIERAHVATPGLEADASGYAALAQLLDGAPIDTVPFALEVGAFELSRPALGALRGHARVEGSLAAHTVTGAGSLETAAQVRGDWTLAARGVQRALALDAVALDVAGGRATATGTLDWGADPALALDAQVRNADPGVLWPALAGRIDAGATVAVSLTQPSWSVRIGSLSGTLRGRPVHGTGEVAYASGAWRFGALELAAGDARATADGEIGERAALRWRVDAPDLGALGAGWTGRVRAHGRVEGDRARPALSGEIDAADVAAGAYAAAAVTGRWSIDLAGGTPGFVELALDGPAVGERRVDAVRVEGSGPVGAHRLAVDVRNGNAHAALGLAGGWDGESWRGRVDELVVAGPALGRWSATEQAAVVAGPRRVSLARACLHDASSTSCFALDWRAGGPWHGEASLEQMPLAAFAPFLPPALDYGGRARGRLDVAGDGRAITRADVMLAVDAGAIAQRDPPQKLIAWDGATARARLAQDRILVDADVQLAGAGELTLDLELPAVPPWRMTEVPVSGRIAGVVQEIPLVAALLPDLSELQGETRIDLRLAGTLAVPAIYGEASFRDGAARLPRLGIDLEDVAIVLHGDGRTLSFDARATSGGGALALGGALAPAAGGWRGDATITGRDFLAVDLPDLRATMSPNVHIGLEGRTVHVRGDVSLPHAQVEPRDLVGAVRPSPDAVVTGAEEEENGSPWTVDAEVRFALGRDVRFHGFGLDAQVSGSVVAVDRPGAVTTATGELRVVEGTYTAYGRELVLERGRLIFTGGPIANPALDARASRKLEEQTVGVDARGTLRAPELKLYSDPPASQSDALAMLLLGRPVSGLSGGEQIELADATRQLGLSGAGFLASQVGRRIGLDEVGIENGSDATQAAFFIGKYLSPKLYVGYGLGLFESFNTVRVRYAVTPSLSLQAESGVEQSADVLYSIER
jgi:translocation and assembly module TamB